MQRVKTGRYLHSFHLVHGITICHINTGILQLRTTVRELVLDNKILRALSINKWSNVGMLRGHNRRHILDAELLELLLDRWCRTRGNLIDHGPRESYLLLILKICDELGRHEALLLPFLCHRHNRIHQLLAIV